MIFGLTKFDINVASFISSFTPCYFLPLKLFFSNWTAGGFLNVPTCLLSSLLSFLFWLTQLIHHTWSLKAFMNECPSPPNMRCLPCILFFYLPPCTINEPFDVSLLLYYIFLHFFILPSLVQSFEGGLIL